MENKYWQFGAFLEYMIDKYDDHNFFYYLYDYYHCVPRISLNQFIDLLRDDYHLTISTLNNKIMSITDAKMNPLVYNAHPLDGRINYEFDLLEEFEKDYIRHKRKKFIGEIIN